MPPRTPRPPAGGGRAPVPIGDRRRHKQREQRERAHARACIECGGPNPYHLVQLTCSPLCAERFAYAEPAVPVRCVACDGLCATGYLACDECAECSQESFVCSATCYNYHATEQHTLEFF